MTTAAGTQPQAAGGARMERYGRPRSAWMRAWPMVPILLFLLVAFVYPVAQLLWLSLFGKTGTFTIEHYQRLFTAPVYFTVLRNTFEIAGWTTLLCIVGGYPIAYLLATTTDRAAQQPHPVGAPAVLDELSGAHLRLDRAARASGRPQQLPGVGGGDRGSAGPALQHDRRHGRHGARADAARGAHHAVGDGDHRPQPDAGRLDARRPRRTGLLAHLLPAVAARRGRGGSPRLHHRARLLHHAGAARQSPADHDHPGGHPAGRGDVELPIRGCHRHADAGHGPLRLLSLRPRARHDDAGGWRQPRASAAPASRARWPVPSAPLAAS